jgi:hypothetical protein
LRRTNGLLLAAAIAFCTCAGCALEDGEGDPYSATWENFWAAVYAYVFDPPQLSGEARKSAELGPTSDGNDAPRARAFERALLGGGISWDLPKRLLGFDGDREEGERPRSRAGDRRTPEGDDLCVASS